MAEKEEAASRAKLLAAQLVAAKADRTIRLNHFNGDMPPFINWCQHVNMCVNAAGWSQEATAQRAKMALKGKAAIWLQNQMSKGVEGLDTWFPAEVNGARVPNLLTLMENRFHTSLTPLEQSQLRATLTMKDSEDVLTFFDRVEHVQLELDRSLPVTFRVDSKAAYKIYYDHQVFNNFVCGLRADIQTHVITANAVTMTDARNAATAFERGTKANSLYGSSSTTWYLH